MATFIGVCAQFNPDLPLFLGVYKDHRIEIFFNGTAGEVMWKLVVDDKTYYHETLYDCLADLEDKSKVLFHKKLKFFFPVEET